MSLVLHPPLISLPQVITRQEQKLHDVRSSPRAGFMIPCSPFTTILQNSNEVFSKASLCSSVNTVVTLLILYGKTSFSPSPLHEPHHTRRILKYSPLIHYSPLRHCCYNSANSFPASVFTLDFLISPFAVTLTGLLQTAEAHSGQNLLPQWLCWGGNWESKWMLKVGLIATVILAGITAQSRIHATWVLRWPSALSSSSRRIRLAAT